MRAYFLVALLIVAYAPAVSAVPPSVINVEIDFMADGIHSHRPQAAEINAIVQMFACHNITLNVFVDDQLTEQNTIIDGPNPNDFFTATGFGTFASIKANNFDNNVAGWHYCVFAHRYVEDGGGNGSSGIAEIGGGDLVVSLGGFTDSIGTAFDRAATFAHELGHNLGLRHGGSQDAAVIGNYKPVYPSIMSYAYQLRGVRTQMRCLEIADAHSLFKEIDYSNGRVAGVNENTLFEPRGVGMRATDWNCDGVIAGGVFIAQDLDDQGGLGNWCGMNGGLGLLEDQNDWQTIQDFTFTTQPPDLTYETCISSDEVANLKFPRTDTPNNCPGSQPTLTVESCVGGEMIYVRSTYSGIETGTGSQPFNTFLEGYNIAPGGSVIYLQPTGVNYSTGFGVLSKPLIIAGPGGPVLAP